ncbi:MAG: AI-2E family transporter [bacterium]|nr:AI-2E family transporter [bacterium]
MNTLRSRYLDLKKKLSPVIDVVQPYLDKLHIDQPSEDDLEDIPTSNPALQESSFPINLFSRKFWLIGGLVVLIAYGLHQISSVLYLIISGYIVAIALERFILFRERLGCKRGFAIGIAYFVLVVLMLSGILVLIPFIVTQISKILQILLDAIQTLQHILETEGLVSLISNLYLPAVIKHRILVNTADQGWVDLLQTTLSNNLNQFISLGSSGLKSAGSLAVSLVNGFFNIFIKVIIVLTIAVFFSLEKIKVIRFISSMTKYPYQTAEKLETLYTKLGHRLEAQLLLSIIIGVLVALGLVVIGRFGIDLPDKSSLALIAGLTEFIPYI